MDNFKMAGRLGRSAAAVSIQACWRGFTARMILKKFKFSQLKGTEVIKRRSMGVSTSTTSFIPLDARYTKPPPPKPAPPMLERVPIAGTLIRERRKSKEKLLLNDKHHSHHPHGADMGKEFRKRRSTAVTAPVDPIFHNAQDLAGYLKKKSGSSSALWNSWKMKWVVVSHLNGELQYYDAGVKNPTEKQIKKIHFKKMLSINVLEPPDLGDLETAKEKPPPVVPTSRTGLKLVATKPVYYRFAIHLLGGESKSFECKNLAELKTWVLTLRRALPRENVFAVQIQRMVRGYLMRARLRRLKRLAVQKALLNREEGLLQIEESRRKSLREMEIRAKEEELRVLKENELQEKEYRRKMRAAKRLLQQQLASLPLDPEWKEYTDRHTGKTYYHNKTTGETRWIKPVVESTLPDQVAASNTFVPAAVEAINAKNATPPTLPSHVEELVDPQSGEIYYYNHRTKTSTWTKPEEEGEASEKASAPAWSKRLDAKTGHYYYYNEASGVSQWEQPADFLDSADVSKEEEEENKKHGANNNATPTKEPPAEEEVNSSLGSAFDTPKTALTKTLDKQAKLKRERDGGNVKDWQKYTDPSSGRVFYTNLVTGEKSWVKPGAQPLNENEAWLPIKDKEGRTYYNNTITGVSVWSLPEGGKLIEVEERRRKSVDRKDVLVLMTSDDAQVKILAGVVDSILNKYYQDVKKSFYVSVKQREGGLTQSVRSGVLLLELFYCLTLDEDDLEEKKVSPNSFLDLRAVYMDLDERIAALQKASGGKSVEEVTKARAELFSLALENQQVLINMLRAYHGGLTNEMIVTPRALVGDALFGDVEENAKMKKLQIDASREVLFDILRIHLFRNNLCVTKNRNVLRQIKPNESLYKFHFTNQVELMKRWLNAKAMEAGGGKMFQFARFGDDYLTEFIFCLACGLKSKKNVEVTTLLNRLVNDVTMSDLSRRKHVEEQQSTILKEFSKIGEAESLPYLSLSFLLGKVKQNAAQLQFFIAVDAFTVVEGESESDSISLSKEQKLQLQSIEVESDAERVEESMMKRFISLYLKNFPSVSESQVKTDGWEDFSLHSLARGQALSKFMNLAQNKPVDFELEGNLCENVLKKRAELLFSMGADDSLELNDLFDESVMFKSLPKNFEAVGREKFLDFVWEIFVLCLFAQLSDGTLRRKRRNEESHPTITGEADLLQWFNERIQIITTGRKIVGTQQKVKFVENGESSENDSSSSPTSASATTSTPRGGGVSSIQRRSSLKRSSGGLRSSFNATREFSPLPALESFGDKALSSSHHILALIDLLKPGCVDWEKIIAEPNLQAMGHAERVSQEELNSKYALAIAAKIGVDVSVSWIDICLVKKSQLVAGLFIPIYLSEL